MPYRIYTIQEIPEQMADGRATVVSYRITDSRTDSRVATCYAQSNAELIIRMLNEHGVYEQALTRIAQNKSSDDPYAWKTQLARDILRGMNPDADYPPTTF